MQTFAYITLEILLYFLDQYFKSTYFGTIGNLIDLMNLTIWCDTIQNLFTELTMYNFGTFIVTSVSNLVCFIKNRTTHKMYIIVICYCIMTFWQILIKYWKFLMLRPLKRGILGASTIILSKDINKYAFMFFRIFMKQTLVM